MEDKTHKSRRDHTTLPPKSCCATQHHRHVNLSEGVAHTVYTQQMMTPMSIKITCCDGNHLLYMMWSISNYLMLDVDLFGKLILLVSVYIFMMIFKQHVEL